VELMTERRKERRRVWGVIGSSSSWSSIGSCSRSCALSCELGAASNSSGEGMLNRARGRGKAGVGVNASDGAGEENAVERAPGEGCVA